MVRVQPHELTNEGLKKLETEIKYLREVARIDNIKALQEARAQGDLSENADYDAARDQQGKINARITEIEGILKNYVIITEDDSDTVKTGKTVVVRYDNEEETETYVVVGSLEADPIEGKISNQSPVGKALLGKNAGQKVEFVSETNKEFILEILEVK
ncbi:transcription elongation factor GreA [Mycoplasmatota bacterium WC44]